MKEKLAALYALQQLDSGIDALKKQFAALDSGKEEQTAYETAKAAHDAAVKSLHEAQGAQRDTELERATVETKRSEVETRLYSGKVTAPKELQMMQEEVEALARRRDRLDEKMLEQAETLSGSETTEKGAKKTLIQTTSAYKARYAAYKEIAERLQAQARLLQKQRGEAAALVDASLLKRYEALRTAKQGVAIARIEDGNACGGCKMGLPSSLVAAVREGRGLVTCDNCGRLLCEIDK